MHGANTYKPHSANRLGREYEAANEVIVDHASATITVSGYGQWEAELQGSNASYCDTDVRNLRFTVEPRPALPKAI